MGHWPMYFGQVSARNLLGKEGTGLRFELNLGSGKKANQICTILAHLRRVKNDEIRWRQMTHKATKEQIEKVLCFFLGLMKIFVFRFSLKPVCFFVVF